MDFSKVYAIIVTDKIPMRFRLHAPKCMLVKNARNSSHAHLQDPCESPEEAAARFSMDNDMQDRGLQAIGICKCARKL
jgi:hypothetical protein